MTTTSRQAALGYVVCVDNSGYPASLEVGKSYRVLSEENAEPDEIRVVDESGEDYLYPASYFSSEVKPLAKPEADPVLYSDVEREARGFIQEHEVLLSGASATVLGHVYQQGANILLAFKEEAIEAANRAAFATNAYADAIGNPAMPAVRLQELEGESARALELNERKNAAFQELNSFLDRVSTLYQQRKGADEEE